jgi:hypothetical protein
MAYISYKVIVNSSQIQKKIENALFQKAKLIAEKKAQGLVNKKKADFLQAFIEHPVSQEILSGPNSNFGVSGQNGNLFSFLGFSDGSEPVQDLYDFFQKNIFLDKNFSYDKTAKIFKFKMITPNIDEIKNVTELSKYVQDENGWGEGRSWALSIERGISGLAFYKFSNDSKILGGDSRSGAGLQRKNQIHPGSQYKPRRYISDLLKILK